MDRDVANEDGLGDGPIRRGVLEVGVRHEQAIGRDGKQEGIGIGVQRTQQSQMGCCKGTLRLPRVLHTGA